MSVDRTIAILSKNSTKKIKAKKTFKIFLSIGVLILFINSHFLISIQLFDYEIKNYEGGNSTNDSFKICYAIFGTEYFW